MERILKIIFLFFIPFLLIAQNSQQVCKTGFSFQISNNLNWGHNEPVVTEVFPGTPADSAGLKINDILLEVNGKGTYLKPAHVIESWLKEDDNNVSLSVRNLESTFKQLSFNKDCRIKNAINEMHLAHVFAYYSLEDVQDREFMMPVKTNSNPDADFFNYRTFDFSAADQVNEELDERINALLAQLLAQKGLRQDKKDPDFIIQTYYSYQNNPLFKEETFGEEIYPDTWRFDVRNNIMKKVPVYDPAIPVKTNDVKYDLLFGFRFYDKKFVDPGKSVLIYESEVNEKLSDNYGLLDYLEVNLPLILLKYPFSKNSSHAKYRVKLTRFNDTGISYDMDDMKTILYLNPASPAHNSGILPGDVVLKVQDIDFAHNSKNLTSNYKRFIAETMEYRDEKTKFTGSDGFSNAMYWDVSHYYNVSRSIRNQKRYKTGFSYLFAFNQFIDWSWVGKLYFEIQRSGETMRFEVKPDLRRDIEIFAE